MRLTNAISAKMRVEGLGNHTLTLRGFLLKYIRSPDIILLRRALFWKGLGQVLHLSKIEGPRGVGRVLAIDPTPKNFWSQ